MVFRSSLISASVVLQCGHALASATFISGGNLTRSAYAGWLDVWRDAYQANDGHVPEVESSMLPAALQHVQTKVVISSGGAAGGVVSEGMGYAIMIEGLDAAVGKHKGLINGLGLVRGWLGMVYGPSNSGSQSFGHPLGGGTGSAESATVVDTAPYGESAINGRGPASAASGMPAWKYPVTQCFPFCHGTATDGDEDAVLGMIYLAKALHYPEDFVDMVVRAVIAFASADLGFPDLYRTLPDGSRMFVPKGGSDWGGLLPEQGPWKTSQQPWCYNPSYFAPGHYRLFRDFATEHWRPAFDAYLPPHLDGSPTTMSDLKHALTGAVTAGYNILFHSSCESGSVSNWVGVKSECSSDDELSCDGVPWAQTPYVGSDGQCTASGTTWGSYGPDASRTPWRIAMDYIMYGEESADVAMYDTHGRKDASIVFSAQGYLNRFVRQYLKYAKCDGADPGKCQAYKLADAFSESAPGMTCHNVPNSPQGWWCPFMSYPTFTAFVAPYEGLTWNESAGWMDTFASLCDFSGPTPTGSICSSSYFELSQEVVATMVMSGAVTPLNGGHSHQFVGPDRHYIRSAEQGQSDMHHHQHANHSGSLAPINHGMHRHHHVQWVPDASALPATPPHSSHTVLAEPAIEQKPGETAFDNKTTCPPAYQECTECCEDGCTCVHQGGGYHQCTPPRGAWQCSQSPEEFVIRRYMENHHVLGGWRRQPNGLMSASVEAGCALGFMVLGSVTAFLVVQHGRRSRRQQHVTRGSFQPLFETDEGVELA